VAGMALMTLCWLRCRAWSPLVARGAAALCVAGVALHDIHLHFAWQVWRLATSTCVLRGRRGTSQHPPSLCLASVKLGAVAGRGVGVGPRVCEVGGKGDGAGAGWGEAQQGEGSGEHGQCPEGVAVAGGALQGSLPDPTRARSTILAALNSGCWSFARLYKLGLGTPPVLSPVALCRFLVRSCVGPNPWFF